MNAMKPKSTAMRALAAVTAATALTFGGASAAFAAEGSATGAATPARGTHPRALGAVLRTAFTAAAETLGMTNQELRAAMLDGPQSVSSVAGDRTGEVTDAIVAALGARLDEAVASGRVDGDRAEELRERIPTFTERLVNRVPGERSVGRSVG